MHIIDIFIRFLRPLFTAWAELHQPFTDCRNENQQTSQQQNGGRREK